MEVRLARCATSAPCLRDDVPAQQPECDAQSYPLTRVEYTFPRVQNRRHLNISPDLFATNNKSIPVDARLDVIAV